MWLYPGCQSRSHQGWGPRQDAEAPERGTCLEVSRKTRGGGEGCVCRGADIGPFLGARWEPARPGRAAGASLFPSPGVPEGGAQGRRSGGQVRMSSSRLRQGRDKRWGPSSLRKS